MKIVNKRKLRKKYRESSLPESIPLWLKHVVKRIGNPKGDPRTVSYRSARWVRAVGRRYENEVMRKSGRKIESDSIRSNRSYSLLSCCAEKVIQNISKKRYYTFNDMMIITDPYYQADLTALAIFYTKKPYSVRYTVKGKTEKADYTRTLDRENDHRVPILGLYPGRLNKVFIELLDENGLVEHSRTVNIRTKRLPKSLRDVIWKGRQSKDSAYKMIMISGGLQIRTVAFDEDGDIRYYLRRYTRSYGVFPLSGGRFLFTEKWINVPCYSVSQACMMYEMDYMGRIYKTYFCEKGFHHSACEMEPGGNILIASSSMEGNEENLIIELDRKSGLIADSFNLNGYFSKRFIEGPGYIHLNSIFYNREENSVIISMRNNNTVAKIDWKTKELIWVLAYPKSYEGEKIEDKILRPDGDIKWFFQQHAARQISRNQDEIQLLIYDNHWAKRVRVDWYDGEMEYSYATVFSINEKEMTVKQLHSIKMNNSRIRSNAILEADKNRLFNMAGSLEPKIDEAYGMVEEYDFEKSELLNRWFVKTGFFTAYPFEPDVNALSSPMEIESEYWKGTTLKMEPYNGELVTDGAKKLGFIENADSEEIMKDLESEESDGEIEEDEGEGEIRKVKETRTRFQEDLLLVECMDHVVSYVYLKGENLIYRGDLTGTYQTKDFQKEKVYEIPFWLKDIEEGSYHIYYDCSGELFDSEEEFRILK